MSYIKIFSFLFFTIVATGIQAEIPYSFCSLLEHNPEVQGFSYSTFENSMEFQREKTSDEFYDDYDVQAVKMNFIKFCRNFETLPKQNYFSTPEQFSIPPIVHLIWLGSEVPLKEATAFNSWKTHHPHWDIKIWTDKELAVFEWSSAKVQQAYNEAVTWAEKADILRLELLYRFGGIYSDADVVCTNSFHDLIVQDIGFFSAFELNYIGKHYGEPFFIGTAVMGSAKHGHVVKYCLDNLRTAAEAPEVGIIKRTGPGLISRACQSVLKNKKENILILPCSYLYPLPWKQRDVTSETVASFLSFETLAIHLWDGSWCTHKKRKPKNDS